MMMLDLPTLPPHSMRLVGMDPSLNNWGLAEAVLEKNGELKIICFSVTQPVVPAVKQIRQNTKDVTAAAQLFDAAYNFTGLAQVVFAEVPVGSQSARAMASYGICSGVLGALRALGRDFIEVSPAEVKRAATGSATATKSQMIQWAIAAHPEANWPKFKRDGVEYISEAKAEHMADAIAAIHAGIRTPMFQQLIRAMTPIAA